MYSRGRSLGFSEDERARLESRLEPMQVDAKFQDKLLIKEKATKKKVRAGNKYRKKRC